MAGNKRKEANRLMVHLPNLLLTNVFGEPFRLTMVDEHDQMKSFHANTAEAVKAFLRTRSPQGSVVIKSMDDALHAQAIGQSLQAAEATIPLPISEHKWLLGRFKEFGHLAFPTDAHMLLDILESGTNGRGPSVQMSQEEDDAQGEK